MSLWRYGWWLDGSPKTMLVSSGAVLPAGKYYWEVQILTGGVGASAGYGVLAGIANASLLVTDTVDASVNLAQLRSQYGIFWTSKVDAAGGTPVFGYPTLPSVAAQRVATAVNDIWAIALNTTTHRIWWRRLTGANTNWNVSALADPATGVGGEDISASGYSPVIGRIYALCGADLGDNPLNTFTSPGSGKVNFGATAFSGTAPTSFVSPYSIYTDAVLSSTDKSASITLSGGNLTFAGNARNGAYADPYSCARSNFSFAQA